MAVYKSNEDGLYLDCRCGCDAGMKFQVFRWPEGDDVSISLYDGSVHRLSEKLRRIKCAIFNKNYYKTDIVLSMEEWEEFYDYILKVGSTINAETKDLSDNYQTD